MLPEVSETTKRGRIIRVITAIIKGTSRFRIKLYISANILTGLNAFLRNSSRVICKPTILFLKDGLYVKLSGRLQYNKNVAHLCL